MLLGPRCCRSPSHPQGQQLFMGVQGSPLALHAGGAPVAAAGASFGSYGYGEDGLAMSAMAQQLELAERERGEVRRDGRVTAAMEGSRNMRAIRSDLRRKGSLNKCLPRVL